MNNRHNHVNGKNEKDVTAEVLSRISNLSVTEPVSPEDSKKLDIIFEKARALNIEFKTLVEEDIRLNQNIKNSLRVLQEVVSSKEFLVNKEKERALLNELVSNLIKSYRRRVTQEEFKFDEPSITWLVAPKKDEAQAPAQPNFFERNRTAIAGAIFGFFIGAAITVVFPPALPLLTALFFKSASTLAAQIFGGAVITAASTLLGTVAGAVKNFIENKIKKSTERRAAAESKKPTPVVILQPETPSPRDSNSHSPRVSLSPSPASMLKTPLLNVESFNKQSPTLSRNPNGFHHHSKMPRPATATQTATVGMNHRNR